ncbi:MAG: hypothetical protein MJ240_03195 [Kiritimatiellae bacterium]|nr:hypothetical protein [Kiritimatiellia bacterium]
MKPENISMLFGNVLLAIVLAGCATKNPYVLSDGYYCGGSYESAAECIKETKQPDASAGHVLDNLYVGSAHFAAQAHVSAASDFSAAEAGLKEQDVQCALGKGIGAVGDILTQGESGYVAATYDETMMNLYQAFSFLAKNNIDRARVEFNRVDQRQGRAAERNAAMIKRNREKIAEAKSNGKNKDAQLATKDAKCDGVAELEAELSKWNAYAEYMNPAAVFMCGAFRLLWGEDVGDCEKGIAYFKRAYGMQPSKVSQRAVEMLENRVNGKATPADREFVMVVFEDGMGPQKIEERKELIIPYHYPIHAGIALPMLQHRPPAHIALSVFDGDSCVGKTETICELDRVVAAEFKEEFKWIATSAVLGVCIRIGVQIVAMELLRKQLDDQVAKGKITPFARDLSLMAAGSSLSAASAAMTHADTRIWSTLPRDYQAVIVPKPLSGKLTIKDASGTRALVEVAVPKAAGASFVYVKIPTSASAATVFAVPGR